MPSAEDGLSPEEIEHFHALKAEAEANGFGFEMMRAHVERDGDNVKARIYVDDDNYLEFAYNTDYLNPMSALLGNAEAIITQALDIDRATQEAERARRAGLN